ncbi:TrbM/KikA/MpfK family conjugal transfer protein [Campylobacter fetus]
MTMLSSLFALNLNANDVLTGDRKTACEVLLCLSSGQRPSECNPPLARFFAIKAKKPWKTLQMRRDFLALCPTDTGNTSQEVIMSDLKDIIASVNPDECKPEYLNTQLQYTDKNQQIIYYVNGVMRIENKTKKYTRINPSMPQFCYNLINHQYTDYQMPKYSCDGKYYTILDFNLGYSLESVTREEYNNLPADEKHENSYNKTYDCGGDGYRECVDHYEYYYKKQNIKKDCWGY